MFPSFVSYVIQCNLPPYVVRLSVTVHVHSSVSINSSQEINRGTGVVLVDSCYIDSLLRTAHLLTSCTQYENLRFDLDKVSVAICSPLYSFRNLFPLRILITECFVLESLFLVKEIGSLQESPLEKYFSNKRTHSYSYRPLYKKENSSLLWK